MTEAEALPLPEDFHTKSVIVEMPLEQLKIDRSYQRDPSQTMADEIASKWSIVASELILVSDRGAGREHLWPENGRYYIVNGQHRSIAARKLGHPRIWARVVDLSDLDDPGAQEALFRLDLNLSLGDRATERFKAKIRAGDDDALEIVRILASFDTQINEVPNAELGINAVSTVEQLYQAELLYDTLALIKDAYGTLGGRVVSSGLMRAVAWFVEKHAWESDRYRVVEKLRVTGVEALYRRAITFQSTRQGSLWVNYYWAMVDLYNDKLSQGNRLEPRLRSSGKVTDSKKGSVKWALHH